MGGRGSSGKNGSGNKGRSGSGEPFSVPKITKNIAKILSERISKHLLPQFLRIVL